MLNAKDSRRAEELCGLLDYTQAQGLPLPGIGTAARLDCFVRHLISSERRNQYLEFIQGRPIEAAAATPFSGSFDPIKASIMHSRIGDVENAYWLVFLITHFGRHRTGGWRYLEEVYGRLNEEGLWDWSTIVNGPQDFRIWLDTNYAHLRRPGAGFGNHRKYESLDAWSAAGTGTVVESYVEWVENLTSHIEGFADFATGVSTETAFARAFESLTSVQRFGRTARFDYLMMTARLHLSLIRPGHAYLSGATGPLRGASLLFDGTTIPQRSAAAIGEDVVDLAAPTGLRFDVLEDALCNWQKQPSSFKPFRG